MIDQIPPDVPPAIVQYADEHFKMTDNPVKRTFGYIIPWNGIELYGVNWSYKTLGSATRPIVIAYNCEEARALTKDEMQATRFLIPQYYGAYINQEHLCHRDQKAYNNHTKPSDYEIKVRHVTPKYVPQVVVDTINQRFSDTRYPGANKRYIKYLTTWKNYEIYVVYWYSKKRKLKTCPHPFFYDGKTVRMPLIEEWAEVMTIINDFYHEHGRPYLYNKD